MKAVIAALCGNGQWFWGIIKSVWDGIFRLLSGEICNNPRKMVFHGLLRTRLAIYCRLQDTYIAYIHVIDLRSMPASNFKKHACFRFSMVVNTVLDGSYCSPAT